MQPVILRYWDCEHITKKLNENKDLFFSCNITLIPIHFIVGSKLEKPGTGLVRVSMAGMKCHDQSSSRREGLIWLTLTSLLITEDGQDRNLQVGTYAEAVEGCSCGLLSLLS